MVVVVIYRWCTVALRGRWIVVRIRLLLVIPLALRRWRVEALGRRIVALRWWVWVLLVLLVLLRWLRRLRDGTKILSDKLDANFAVGDAVKCQPPFEGYLFFQLR